MNDLLRLKIKSAWLFMSNSNAPLFPQAPYDIRSSGGQIDHDNGRGQDICQLRKPRIVELSFRVETELAGAMIINLCDRRLFQR